MPAKRFVTEETDPFAFTAFEWPVAFQYVWAHRRVTDRHRLNLFWPGYRPPTVDGADHVLVAVGNPKVREYRPLTVPGLFETFAATAADRDGVLAFASEYGQLGASVGLRPKPPPSSASPRHADTGEPFWLWTREIDLLRLCRRWLRAIRAEGDVEARHWFLWWRERTAEETTFARLQGITPPHEDAWVLLWRNAADEITDMTVLDPNTHSAARLNPTRKQFVTHALASQINRRLEWFCAPRFRSRSETDLNMQLRVVPLNLLGAIWWQFARLVNGEARYQPCEACGRLIELSTGDHGFRSDRRFCSKRCKFKGHRLRVKRAQEMSAEGHTPRQIAAALETDAEAVKRWLAKTK